MRTYGLLLKRDIGKNPWNFLMIILILLISFASSNASMVWVALFIIFAGWPLLKLSEHNGSAFSMLLPKAKQYEFNYAVVFSSVLCSLFSLSITHTFTQALLVFSCIYLCLSVISLLIICSNKHSLGKIVNVIFVGILVFYLGTKYQWFSGLISSFRLDNIALHQTLLTTVFLLLSVGSIWILRKSFMQRVELNPEKFKLDLISMNSKFDLGGNFKNKGEDNKFRNRYLTFSNKLFGFLVSDKQLHKGLYPQFIMSNQLNAVFLLSLVAVSFGYPIFLSLTSPPQDYWSQTMLMGVLLSLSFIIINLAHTFDFVSNRKLMAYLWLKDGSKSRKNYMGKLAKLMLARQVSSLCIFSAFTLGLSYLLLGEISPSLIVLALAGCMATIVQIAFTLNMAISQDYTAGLRYGTLAFFLFSYSISWLVLTGSKELAIVFTGFGLIFLAIIWWSWLNADLELK